MKKYFSKYLYLSVSMFFVPIVSFGFTLGGASTLKTVIDYVRELVNLSIPILSGLAFIVFFWGLSKFILNSDKPDEIKNGKKYMMWGILALFILLTFRTIIGLISNELEIGPRVPNENNILLPTS